MDKLYKILLLVGLLAGALLAQSRAPQDESFDPLTLNEPFLPIASGSMIKEIFTGVAQHSQEKRDSLRYIERMGWKIQALSIKDGVRADSVLSELSQVFGEENTQMIWNSPYWKIRVGNCTTRMEAERLLARVKRMGYDRAWIIRSRIKIKEKQIPFKE